MVEKITLKILRSIPSKGVKPTVEKYSVPVFKGMTVLDSLLYVKGHLDHSVSFRYSCRMGNCGSCSMVVNGSPRLTCQTQISELGTKEVEVRPLENFPVIRDLVSDYDEFYDKHREVKPYLIRRDKTEEENPTSEYLQSREELDKYIQFALCIKCGQCFHACPITSTDIRYLGPQALSQAYRYLTDSRDQDNHERIETVNTRNGCWGCHLAESCSEACPKGVDPSLGIQLLRRMVLGSGNKKRQKG